MKIVFIKNISRLIREFEKNFKIINKKYFRNLFPVKKVIRINQTSNRYHQPTTEILIQKSNKNKTNLYCLRVVNIDELTYK